MKRTPLYDAHREAHARMVAFAGWEMPIQYQGINQEHLAVRQGVGLFDVSHMGEIRVRGAEAEAFLRFATLNDVAKLKPGRGHYSMLPNDRGGLIDDLYLYRHGEEDFLIVANAANTGAVLAQLSALAESYDAQVEDESDRWALLALQGPKAQEVLSHWIGELDALKKNRFRAASFAGKEVSVARTGYTGEDGFELFCAPEDAPTIWRALLERGVTPCGLGARDTLRLEAGFPLYGHEFTESTNPLCTDYAWVVKDKPFFGREAMWNPHCEERLVGLTLLGRGIPREGYPVLSEGARVGTITSGTLSPLTKKGIAMAWLAAALAEVGQKLTVEIRAAHVDATVVKPPFYP